MSHDAVSTPGLEEAIWELALTLAERATARGGPAERESSGAATETAAASPPAWWQELAAAYGRQRMQTAALVMPPSGSDEEIEKLSGLFQAVAPLVSAQLAGLRPRIAALAAAFRPGDPPPFDPATVERLLPLSLPERLVGMASRTLVLELHAARLLERLAGETPEERFASFTERLAAPAGMLGIFAEYPVLARQMALRAATWLGFGMEFLEHLCADWPEIRRVFSPQSDPGPLVALEGGWGDRHRGGREVLMVTFASGLELVYKPRPLAADLHFQELLAWLNAHGQEPPLSTIAVLPRDGHGWMERLAAAPCREPEEVHRFYRRQGSFLALLYALDASDFHSENLIAAGEHPILVDLESLFQAPVGGMDAKQSDLVAAHTLGRSVLRVGLLPQRVWGDREQEGIDMSGLGGEGGQPSPRPVPYWRDPGTDAMRLDRRREALPEGHHRPRLDGKPAGLLAHAGDLEAGFTATYRLLARHRAELVAPGGPIERFAGDELRAILRPTQAYGALLGESFHPELLRDALDRERHFDGLHLAVPNRPFLARVLDAERADLWRGDIPIFASRPGSRDLVTSTGETIPEFFDRPGLEVVRERVAGLSEHDLRRQLWFLRASLVVLTVDLDTALWPSYAPRPPRAAASRDRLLAAASAVGDHLHELALWGAEEATWIGLTINLFRHPELVPLKLDLYSGAPGLALFLGYLGSVGEERRFTRLARAALAGARRLARKDPALVTCIGGLGGWGGLVYALTHLATLWRDPALLAEAEEMVTALPPRIEEDDHHDWLAGAAGCLAGLLAFHSVTASERALAAAVVCGERLLAHAVPGERGGIGWMVDPDSARPWGGLAHGSAGCALALLRLAAVTGDSRYRDAAVAAMEHERTLWNPEVGNWRDARDLDQRRMAVEIDGGNYMTAWCHGSTGIGMARLAGLPCHDDCAVRAEIDAALADVLANGFGQNHSLCHGDLGNLDFLQLAAERLDAGRWRPEVERHAAAVLDSIEDHGWLCGVALGVETPGLMTGLAGIGYGLLRLAAPEHVPSLLVLEPPR
jgi:type 2 lantibiotic biosynthesis protein LanM